MTAAALLNVQHSASIDDVLAGRARWALIHGDCMPILAALPDAAVDHVITDPPYDAKTHAGARCRADAPDGVAFAALPDARGLSSLLVAAARRWAVAFCTVEDIGAYRDGAGVSWVRAGVWDRVDPSPQLTGDRPGQAVEAVAVMHRPGKKRWNRGGGAAIWRHSVDRGAQRPDHPTPKPVSLMADLVADFTDPDDIILDPFAGSATTGVACLRLGRRFIGIEKDPKFYADALARLQAEDNGQTLHAARAGQVPLFGKVAS
jgi:site-specific DNA-methyltransferase (adenine-specific)